MGAIPARPGPILVPGVPSRMGLDDPKQTSWPLPIISGTDGPFWGRAKGAAKGSCGATVVQKGDFGESVSSLPP